MKMKKNHPFSPSLTFLQPGALCWHYYSNWLNLSIFFHPKKLIKPFFNFLFEFFLLPKMDHSSIPIDLTKSILMVVSTFVIIIGFCEIGEMVSNQFNSFNAELVECNWYLYPIKMQQMFMIFMSNAQQPTNIHGYGNILCTRRTVEEARMCFFKWMCSVQIAFGVFLIVFFFCSINFSPLW